MSNQTLTSSQSNRGTTTMQQLSQHKRSLSFNHHLSYNQYSGHGANGRLVAAAASLNNQVVNREKNDQMAGPGGRVSLNNAKGVYNLVCSSPIQLPIQAIFIINYINFPMVFFGL